MRLDAAATVPRAVPTPSPSCLPAVFHPSRSSLPLTDSVTPPDISGEHYRRAVALDDPVGYAHWAGTVDDRTWGAIASGLNALLPSRLCPTAEQINGQFKQQRTRLSRQAQAWCEQTVLLVREPIGWHDVRTDRRFEVSLIVRALHHMGQLIGHVEALFELDSPLRQEILLGGVFDEATLTMLRGELHAQRAGAKAWALLPSEATRPFEPLGLFKGALQRIRPEDLYRVHDELDRHVHWLVENHGQRDRRVRRWWTSWSGPTTRSAAWITSFDDATALRCQVAHLAAAIAAWHPANSECDYALAVLTKESNVVPRRATPWSGQQRYELKRHAIHTALAGLQAQCERALREISESGHTRRPAACRLGPVLDYA